MFVETTRMIGGLSNKAWRIKNGDATNCRMDLWKYTKIKKKAASVSVWDSELDTSMILQCSGIPGSYIFIWKHIETHDSKQKRETKTKKNQKKGDWQIDK